MRKGYRTRKAQSAIEYLTTYGWAILIIGVVIAFLASQGVFSQCSKTQPRFTGQAAQLSTWDFTATNSIFVEVEATTQEVNLTDVRLDYDEDGTWDKTKSIAGGTSLSPGGGGTSVDVDTGSQFSSGDCATMELGLNVTFTQVQGNPFTLATGDGILQRTVP